MYSWPEEFHPFCFPEMEIVHKMDDFFRTWESSCLPGNMHKGIFFLVILIQFPKRHYLVSQSSPKSRPLSGAVLSHYCILLPLSLSTRTAGAL